MKILGLVMIAFLMLSLVVPGVLAQDDSDVSVDEVTEEELEMDEDVTTGKVAWENVKLWFTFNQERKIEREMNLARLRLIQAKVAAKNNNSEAVERALEAHERIMNRVQVRMGAMEVVSNGENETALKLVGLERAIQVHERRITFLNNVVENADLTDAQRAKVEARLGKVETVTGKLKEINEAKQEQVKTRLMAAQGLTEEEAEALMEQKREQIKDRIRERINRTDEGKQTETQAENQEDSGQQQGQAE